MAAEDETKGDVGMGAAISAKVMVNDASDAVTEMIEGFLMMNPQLTRLDGFDADIKVILRRDWNPKTAASVALISGGGSGHEPAHAGYIGEGMLTAAVCGNIYASPSVAAVLAAIRAVGGAPGVLLIVKNYTGDRLHFGIAAEKAKLEGIQVETVFVGDDVAVDTGKITGRRGIAGTVFVHKVAGAAAAAGKSLKEVAAEAQAAADAVRSLGVATSVCTVPGQTRSDRLDGMVIEIGLGIHGEPGASRSKPLSANQVADTMVERILADAPWFTEGTPVSVAALINNLGASTGMELSIIAGRVVAQLAAKGVTVTRIMAGPFMTALDMSGVSLSLIPVDEARTGLLDAPTTAGAWPRSVVAPNVTPEHVPVPSTAEDSKSFSRPDALTAEGKALEAAIVGACDALIAAEPKLTRLDTVAGDGDCGTTLKAAAEQIKAACADHYPLNSAKDTLEALGQTIKRFCAGSSGAFYDIMCSAAEGVIAGAEDPWAVPAWAAAFRAGVDAIMHYGNARPGACTMVDALVPACDSLDAAVAADASLSAAAALAAAAGGARTGADSTSGMAAAAGRASYVEAERVKDVVDAGAEAVAAWLAGAQAGVSGSA